VLHTHRDYRKRGVYLGDQVARLRRVTRDPEVALSGSAGKKDGMRERPRILMLDLLESFARERGVAVRLERRPQDEAWTCTLRNGDPVSTTGSSAREAIRRALKAAGVDLP
jgi:hypothetical protein